MLKVLTSETVSLLKSSVNINSSTQAVVELVLNSIDAGAKNIRIKVELNDFKFEVTDDGFGVSEENFDLIGTRHATSKCRTMCDLRENIRTFGFRGESLSSLIRMSASVKIESTSRTENSDITSDSICSDEHTFKTFSKTFKNGESCGVAEEINPRRSSGTAVAVSGFMYCIPVRRKCAKERENINLIQERLEIIALIHPNISFSLRDESRSMTLLHTKQSSSVLDIVGQFYGEKLPKTLCEVFFQYDEFTVKGYIGREFRQSKDIQLIYINKKIVFKTKLQSYMNDNLKKASSLDTRLITEASECSPKCVQQNPVYILNLECPPSCYEILQESTKTYLEFRKWGNVFSCLEGMLSQFRKETSENSLLENSDSDESGDDYNMNCTTQDDAAGSNESDIRNVSKYGKSISIDDIKAVVHGKVVTRTKNNSNQVKNHDISENVRTLIASKPVPSYVSSLEKFKRKVTEHKKKNIDLTKVLRTSKSAPELKPPLKPQKLHSRVEESRLSEFSQYHSMSPSPESDTSIDDESTQMECCDMPPKMKSEMSSLQMFRQQFLSECSHKKAEISSQYSSSNELNQKKSLEKPFAVSKRKSVDPILPTKDEPSYHQNLLKALDRSHSSEIGNIEQFTDSDSISKLNYLDRNVCAKRAKIDFQDNIESQIMYSECQDAEMSTSVVLNASNTKHFRNAKHVFNAEHVSNSEHISNTNISPAMNIDKSPISRCKEISDVKINSELFHSQNDRVKLIYSDSINVLEMNLNGLNEIDEDEHSIYFNHSGTDLHATSGIQNSDFPKYSAGNFSADSSGDSLWLTQMTNREYVPVENISSLYFSPTESKEHPVSKDIEKAISTCPENETIVISKNEMFPSEDNSCVEKGSVVWRKTVNEKGQPCYINTRSGNSRFDAPVSPPQNFSPDYLDVKCEDPKPKITIQGNRQDGASYSRTGIDNIHSIKEQINSDVPKTVQSDKNEQYIFTKDLFQSCKVIGQLDRKFILCSVVYPVVGSAVSAPLLVAFDQHAVHERIRLEKIMKENQREGTLKSTNISPPLMSCSISASDTRLMLERRNQFKVIGITFDTDSEEKGVGFNAIPTCLMPQNMRHLASQAEDGNYLAELPEVANQNGSSESKSIKVGGSSGLLRHNRNWREYVLLLVEAIVKHVIDNLKETRCSGAINSALPPPLLNALHTQACRGAIKFGQKLSVSQCSSLISSLSDCQLPYQCAHGRPSVYPIHHMKPIDTIQFPDLKKITRRS